MGTKSRETIYGASIRAAAERATEARKEADRLAVEAWNKRMLGFQGPAQPSPTLGDAINAGFGYLEVKCLGCDTHQTVALDILRRPKTTPVHELERYMRRASAPKSGAMPTSAAIWSRCARPRDHGERSAVDVVAGRAVNRTKCNLYSITTNQAAIAALFRVVVLTRGEKWSCLSLQSSLQSKSHQSAETSSCPC
jgi:hypothetical protein